MTNWLKTTVMYLVPILALTLSSCSDNSSSSNNAPEVEITKSNLLGQWDLKKVTANNSDKDFEGNMTIAINDDDTLVNITQEFSFSGKEACTSLSEEKISSIENEKITLALKREIAAKKCLTQSYDPYILTVKSLTMNDLLLENNSALLYFSRRTNATLSTYDALATKFESAEVTINDPDKVSGFELKYRNPNRGGWKHLCPRLAGAYYNASGFGTNPTFLYGNDVYEVSMEFDEGVIDPVNYTGPTPDFRIHKRAANSTDQVSYVGPGLYYCSSLSSCASKCTLTFDEYSLLDSKAKFKIECSQLPAESAEDPLNMFGNELSGFSLLITCNYRPLLISD